MTTATKNMKHLFEATTGNDRFTSLSVHLFVSFVLCIAAIFTFSSFSGSSHGKCNDVPRVKRHVTSKKMKAKKADEWNRKLTDCAASKNFSQFGSIATKALCKGFPEKRFEALINDLNLPPLQKALLATKTICKRCHYHGLTMPEIFQMAIFIETKIRTQNAPEKTYFSRNTTGLPRSIQIDPETGMVFIHLKNHGVCALGKGAKKKVTRSIFYSDKNPEILAHCFSSYKIDNEIQAVKDLRGLPGLYEVKAILQRRCKDGRIAHSMMTKLYTGGDLHTYLAKNGKKLRMIDKLRLAHNILVGIESMHTNGYAHRDLGMKNYFVDNVPKGKRKQVVAIVGDLGRACKSGNTKERGAQGGYSQLAPEAIAYDKLQGDDYIYTDLYALGCTFYRIVFGNNVPWQDKHMIANHKIPVDIRIGKATESINKFKNLRAAMYTAKKKKKRPNEAIVAFEQLVMKMTDPVPLNRGNATELREMLEKIMRDHHKALKKKKLRT